MVACRYHHHTLAPKSKLFLFLFCDFVIRNRGHLIFLFLYAQSQFRPLLAHFGSVPFWVCCGVGWGVVLVVDSWVHRAATGISCCRLVSPCADCGCSTLCWGGCNGITLACCLIVHIKKQIANVNRKTMKNHTFELHHALDSIAYGVVHLREHNRFVFIIYP